MRNKSLPNSDTTIDRVEFMIYLKLKLCRFGLGAKSAYPSCANILNVQKCIPFKISKNMHSGNWRIWMELN